MAAALKFKSLKKLSLGWLEMDEEMIKCLITSCTLLEDFILHHCYGFKRVCIYGLPNLQKVRVHYWPEVEQIDIEAPNLRHLFLLDYKSHVVAPSMNLALCKNLTTLCFCGYFSRNTNGFGDFLTNFSFIENLVLTTPQHCNNLKLSSNTLRTLVLHSQCQLDVIEINTPNLLLFNYSFNTISPEPCVINSVESKVCMECYPNSDVDTLWFHKLRRFLDNHNMFKILKLNILETLINVEELKVIKSPPFELEHVDLELRAIKELSVYLGVLEAVLWCCRPKSLTLLSKFFFIDYEEWNHVIKCTYERLLEQEDQSHTNYIQIVSSFSSKIKNRFSDLDSMFRALPCHPKGLTVTFIKEKVVQGETGILV